MIQLKSINNENNLYIWACFYIPFVRFCAYERELQPILRAGAKSNKFLHFPANNPHPGSRGRICHRLHRWHHADGNGYHCHCHRPAVLPSKKALRSTAESKHPAHERDVCFLQRDQPQFNSPFDGLSTAGNPQLCVQRR